MRRLPGLLAALAVIAALASIAASAAHASLLITVDKSAQQMTVTVDGDPRYIWPVSTGREGYDTPAGQYTPFRMEKDHFSREWDDAPMPYSIFFTKQGHAIHGTNHKIDGSPESHGCVRLSVNHAAQLWALVKSQGMANVRVELDGRIPSRGELMARREPGSGIIDRDDRSAAPDAGRSPMSPGAPMTIPASPAMWRCRATAAGTLTSRTAGSIITATGRKKCAASRRRRAARCAATTATTAVSRTGEAGGMIRKLSGGKWRLYSRKKNPKTGKRRNLGTFDSKKAAVQHEREIQYFKRH